MLGVDKGTAMDMDTLRLLLNTLKDLGDPEIAHIGADEALLMYINDAQVTEAFEAIKKWYS